MLDLKNEIKINFERFQKELRNKYSESYDVLAGYREEYRESYERISSLVAWRAYLFEQIIKPDDVLNFFIEAQNDALLSYMFSSVGIWRTALQSLRSVLDNILFFLYYKDHPIEYKLWSMGKHQLPISEYQIYLEKHPNIIDVSKNITGIDLLKSEYSNLSRAVHGSSVSFRMTNGVNTFPVLMMPDLPKLNQWLTRERRVLKLINLLLLTLFAEHLHGTYLRDLRKSISLVIPNKLHDEIKSQLNVKLFITSG